MILKLSVNNQSVESSGITKDYKDALCEYVWNSFEANATAVAIDCIPNELTGSAEIVITDNGDGIAYDSLERTFGAFLASQKNSRSLQIKTKANKGKGRFSCFSFASLAEWSTVTATPDGNIAYTISLENADKNQCDVSDPAPTTRSTGTRLIISGIDGICEDDVSFAQLEDTMLKAFAWYLYLNKDTKGNHTEFSIDLAIVFNDRNGCHRLIHEKTGFTAWDRYYWNLVPNSRNLFDKVAAIKDEHLWDEVIDEYLEKKNMYLRRQDYNHPSFNVYVETVNQVFNKYFD